MIVALGDQTPETNLHIILFMRGMVVTGTVISRGERLKVRLEEVFTMTGQQIQMPEVENSPRTPRYVHLKNPRFSYPVPGHLEVEQDTQPYVRIRLSSIDGWMLGTAKRG